MTRWPRTTLIARSTCSFGITGPVGFFIMEAPLRFLALATDYDGTLALHRQGHALLDSFAESPVRPGSS
jgi:hypothetical protein